MISFLCYYYLYKWMNTEGDCYKLNSEDEIEKSQEGN
jgi:hypothetical protein